MFCHLPRKHRSQPASMPAPDSAWLVNRATAPSPPDKGGLTPQQDGHGGAGRPQASQEGGSQKQTQVTSPGLGVSTTAERLAKGSTRSQNNTLLNKNPLQREHGACPERNFTGFCQESVNGVTITMAAPVGVTGYVFTAVPLLSVLA